MNRIAKILGDYGFRTQRSIFEVDVDAWQLRELQKRIGAVLEPVEDGVKYFRVCRRCVGPWYATGMVLSTDWTQKHVII